MSASPPPSWLPLLLSSDPPIPSAPYPPPHNLPRHPSLQTVISSAELHPALEAALHLINADLYSAHFLVRKMQGGAREGDWGHAVLHRLEGDIANAKCWYTDLVNLPNSSLFHSFWSSSSSCPTPSTDLEVTPHSLALNPIQFLDLLLLYSTMPDSSSSSTTSNGSGQSSTYPLKLSPKERQDPRAIAKSIHSTSEYAEKIKGGYSIEELEGFAASLLLGNGFTANGTGTGEDGNIAGKGASQLPATRAQVLALARSESKFMVHSLSTAFGWQAYDQQDSVRAFLSQSGKGEDGKGGSEGEGGQRVEHDSQGMILRGGQRNF